MRPSRLLSILRLLPFLVVVWLGVQHFTSRERHDPDSDSWINEIAGRLRQETAPASQSGIAAAILIDTSGSMSEEVSDGTGNEQPKIEIARRAGINLARQFAGFAAANPSERVVVGLYEFSGRSGQPTARAIVPLAPPNVGAVESAIARLEADGDTPIGDAMITAKRDLDSTGFDRRHLLVITDGENTQGVEPEVVAKAIGRLVEAERPSIYFVAFDVEANRFSAVRDAGALILAAANERELTETLDYLLTGKILVEPTQP